MSSCKSNLGIPRRIQRVPSQQRELWGTLYWKMASARIVLLLVLCWTTPSLSARRSYGCRGCQSYGSGRNLGQAVAGRLGDKLQHIAGFFSGLAGGGGCTSCGGASSNSYYTQPSPVIVVQQPAESSHSHSSYSSASNYISSNQIGGGQSYNPAGYPDCQCDFLFNSAGQGNCNSVGSTSHTRDRWCYVVEQVEAGWVCPDAVASDVHHGR